MSNYDELIEKCEEELRLFERPSAGSSKRLLGAVKELLADNMKLAAFQCHSGYSAEGGHLGCHEIDTLKKEIKRLNELVQRYKRFAEASVQYVDALEKLIGD